MFENKCPYCHEEVEIDTEDGYGLDEEQTHQQECYHCEKTFVFTTSIIVMHDLKQADCLNGAPHNFKPVTHTPAAWPDWVRCATCGEERQGEFRKEVMDEYRANREASA